MPIGRRWSTFSHASAYATARPRAPDGIQTRTAVACSIDAPHCRLSPTGNSCGRKAPLWYPFPAPLASKHHNAAHMRRSQPRPCLGARGRATRMLQGGKKLPWWNGKNLVDACASSANAENKTPPGLATRGRSRSSGDRGGRSPRESAGCQVSRCRARSMARLPPSFARSARPQRDGCRADLLSKE